MLIKKITNIELTVGSWNAGACRFDRIRKCHAVHRTD